MVVEFCRAGFPTLSRPAISARHLYGAVREPPKIRALFGNCLKAVVWLRAVARPGCWSLKRSHPNSIPEGEGEGSSCYDCDRFSTFETAFSWCPNRTNSSNRNSETACWSLPLLRLLSWQAGKPAPHPECVCILGRKAASSPD